MNDPTEEDLRKYRFEHFACEVKAITPHGELGEVMLSVTRNGHAWQSIALTPYERLRVVQALLAVAP